MSSNVTVCCCDRYPGMHPVYKECRENEDDTIFLPNKLERQFMKECTNMNHEDEDGDTVVHDGVCQACGTVVDEYKAIEASNQHGCADAGDGTCVDCGKEL